MQIENIYTVLKNTNILQLLKKLCGEDKDKTKSGRPVDGPARTWLWHLAVSSGSQVDPSIALIKKPPKGCLWADSSQETSFGVSSCVKTEK